MCNDCTDVMRTQLGIQISASLMDDGYKVWRLFYVFDGMCTSERVIIDNLLIELIVYFAITNSMN